MAEPWQRAEIGGPVKAKLVSNPKRASEVLMKFKYPVVSVGSEILKLAGEEVLEPIEKICRTINASVTSTSPSVLGRLRGAGLRIKPSSLLELSDRLIDSAWRGIDGNRRYDLAILLGFHYYYSWVILSGLKSFAYEHLKTFSLDRYYQPHATYSLPNFVVKDRWVSFMRSLAEALAKTGEST